MLKRKTFPWGLTFLKKSGIIYMRGLHALIAFGAAMVSTGVLRYDKRGGQDNPVKLSNLKIKRQQ